MKAVQEIPEVCEGGKDLSKMYVLSLEWKSDGVMDAESGDGDKDGSKY